MHTMSVCIVCLQALVRQQWQVHLIICLRRVNSCLLRQQSENENILHISGEKHQGNKKSFCNFYLSQGICRHVIMYKVSIATSAIPTITTQACNCCESKPMQPVLWHLQPLHTHATGTYKSWPVKSANLKRKMRSWWGAEGPVQRRPVEGCRAEKILHSTNKNMEKKKGR